MKYFRTCTGLKHRNYRHILGISDTAYIYIFKTQYMYDYLKYIL